MRLRVNTVLLRHLLLLFSEIFSLIRVGSLWTHTNSRALALETLAMKRVCRTLLQQTESLDWSLGKRVHCAPLIPFRVTFWQWFPPEPSPCTSHEWRRHHIDTRPVTSPTVSSSRTKTNSRIAALQATTTAFSFSSTAVALFSTVRYLQQRWPNYS